MVTVPEDHPLVDAASQRKRESGNACVDGDRDRLAGVSVDVLGFAVVPLLLVQLFNLRHLPPCLGAFDPVGQQNHATAHA